MSDNTTKTGLLLLLFRRPDLTELLLSSLTALDGISHIFIHIDGPSSSSSQDERSKIDHVITLAYNFSPKGIPVSISASPINLGCRQSVVTAINSSFLSVEQLIILEDDCIPSRAFIPFCIAHFPVLSDCKEVFSIVGSSYIPQFLRPSTGSYFSVYGDSSGWATTKYKWQTFSNFPYAYDFQLFDRAFRHSHLTNIERHYWHSILRHQFSTSWHGVWDYQWFISCILSQGLHLVSSYPLISNLGYRPDGTHTQHPTKFAAQTIYERLDVTLPTALSPSRLLDFVVFWTRREGNLFFLRKYFYPLYLLTLLFLRLYQSLRTIRSL